MQKRVVIALDAMGGDFAPHSVLLGTARFISLQQGLEVCFRIFGDSVCIAEILKSPKCKVLLPMVEVLHAEEVVHPEEKPAIALRKKKNSSMYKAVQDVKEGRSDCVLSAGNTGAFMAISKILLGMLPNVQRPAIVTTIPTSKNEMVVLDLGANLECNSDVLFQFGVMGVAFAKSALALSNPSVGLLNIGTEENKGTDALKEAFHNFKDQKESINFKGFIEPMTILDGEIDVLVTDGFSGNIMLKTAESMYHLIKDGVKNAAKSSFLGFLGGILLCRPLKKSLSRFSPELRNGAMLIGLNGVAVKAHGSSDSGAFANSIKIATEITAGEVNAQITENIYGNE